MKVFIADDEVNVRQGLKQIINWEKLGFEICGEAGNGLACLEGILREKPDLVLLDIQMPKMLGIQVVKNAREQGFKGKFIILSGYSDFQYAQSAIPYGIEFYLLKPIDEDELTSAVITVYEGLLKESQEKGRTKQIFVKAKDLFIKDIILGQLDNRVIEENTFERSEIGLDSKLFKIILLEKFRKKVEHSQIEVDLMNLFHLSSTDLNSIDHIVIKEVSVIFLKGEHIINKVEKTLINMEKSDLLEKQNIYIVCGKSINDLSKVHDSYKACLKLLERKFFAKKSIYCVSEDSDYMKEVRDYLITEVEGTRFHDLLYKNIESYNRTGIKETVQQMHSNLSHATSDMESIKNFITGILLHIKHDVTHDYKKCDIPFQSNTDMIASIQKMDFLYEVLDYMEDQMVQIIKAIGNSTCESILSDILHYIDLNFRKNLKLETIAAVFGYNSAYLGKVFTKNMGQNFNSYVDKVRIDYAKELVLEDKLKVYEIAENVGYKNLDYFHRKFKKYVGFSPAEYRKMIKEDPSRNDD